MIPGDIPCNEPCYNTLCHWCCGGCCLDNVPCPAQDVWHMEDVGK